MLTLGPNKWKTIAIVFMIATPLMLGLGYVIFSPASIPEFNPVIDGFIEEGWERADFKLAQYLNLPDWRDPENEDGFNYIYAETDDENLYLAIDMPSDLNGTTDNEFLGIFLNTMDREFNSFISMFGESFEAYRNNGTEALVYDFQNEQIVPFIFDADGMKQQYHDYIENTTGEEVSFESGVYANSGYDDWTFTYEEEEPTSDIIWLNSTEFGYGSDIFDRVCINFSIHLANYFNIYDDEDYVEQLIDDLENVQINMSALIWAMSLSVNKFHIEGNGTYNDAPFVGTESIFDVNKSAYENGDLIFSIEIAEDTDVHVEHFWWLCDYINIQFNKSDSIDSVYGGTTIEEYILEYNFSTSINSELDHRMYEISIPLSELEGFNATGNMGLFVCGNVQIEDGNPSFSEKQSYQFTGNTELLYFLWFIINYPSDPDWSDNYQVLDLSKFD